VTTLSEVALERAVVAAVEGGGTKFRAAAYPASILEATEPLESLGDFTIDTTTPAETLGQVVDVLTPFEPQALGIATFGPLNLDRSSSQYGSIAATPKPDWSGAPILDDLARGLGGIAAGIQTDVEAAAIAELRQGAGRGFESVAYVTVGTGIGVGVVVDGQVFRGRDHLELGHIPVSRTDGDEFAGRCPFHGDCLEGMVSGPALLDRFGPEHVSPDHHSWELVADYLAQLATVITWSFSPDRILFSGGVGHNDHLEPLLRDAMARRLGGYSVSHADNRELIGLAQLGNDAGLIGAAILAADVLSSC